MLLKMTIDDIKQAIKDDKNIGIADEQELITTDEISNDEVEHFVKESDDESLVGYAETYGTECDSDKTTIINGEYCVLDNGKVVRWYFDEDNCFDDMLYVINEYDE